MENRSKMFWITINLCKLLAALTIFGKEPPSLPIINGLQNLDNCTKCIVGEVGEKFNVSCVINNGTGPFNVTMTIGNEIYTPYPYNSTEQTYIVFFILHDRHHMENVSFSVMNATLSSPLKATPQVFVVRPSSVETFLVPKILRVGEDVNITCTVDGGRPIPILYFNISGFELSSEYLHYSSSPNRQIVSLTSFKREWNRENITCCRYNKWYKNKLECLQPKQVDYLFPPSNVKLKVEFDEERQNQMYAVCTVHNSNSVCKVRFNAPGDIIGSEMISSNYSLLHGAWNSKYIVDLNVSKEDNGTNITCVVVCKEFSVNLTDTVSILLPYPPVIKFNISGSVLNIIEGKQAHVECFAESFPSSNISWFEGISNENVTKKRCYLASSCILSFDAGAISERRFICSTHYLTSTDHKHLTVHILENANKEEHRKKQDNIEKISKLVIWIVFGSCLLVVGVIIAYVLFVVIRKRSHNFKERKESRVSNHVNTENMEIIRNAHNPEYYYQVYQNVTPHSREIVDEVQEYSQPVKNKIRENVDNTYSQVNQAGISAQPHSAEDGQLIYADLDLDPSETSSTRVVVKRRDSPTEYTDIDYVKAIVEKNIPRACAIADKVPVYSKPKKKQKTENVDNTYSQENKAGSSLQPHHEENRQLLYADLDFDPKENPSKGAVVKRRDPPTEYADIDFVKTKAKKEIMKSKSVNANQKSNDCANGNDEDKSICKIM